MIRLGGPAHEILTKTVQKTLPGGVGVGGLFDMKLTLSVEVNLIQHDIMWIDLDLLFIRETGCQHFACFILNSLWSN